MKILLVIDQFDADNNGTTISARRFADTLSSHGNDVRVISTGAPREGKYAVEEYHVPVFDKLIKAQGMSFAHVDRALLREAISWAEIVHFLVPFPLSIEGVKICEEMKVPHTAAFHVQPENITSSIHMGHVLPVNTAIYAGFRDLFYNRFSHIHCPSRFIASQLEKHHYKATLHVISNGIDSAFVYKKQPKLPEWADKIVVTNVGRLSVEKRQDIFLEAINKSKYRERIQPVIAGQGPRREVIQKLGSALPNPPHIAFYPKEELAQLLRMSDIYLHTADVEIEAISCMEAFASGLVPVIANSKKSATPQFALDERSLFKAGDSDDLARKLDYWLDHPEEKAAMEHAYAEQGKNYHIDRCVAMIEDMFRQAIEENGRTT